MNRKRIIHCAAAILMAAASLSAQNKSAGINLSIWKGISTQPLDSTQISYLNLGIFSTMNRLNGVGINALGSVARKDMNGIQLSGLSSLTGGSMRGMQLSGICNVNGNNMAGMSASGLINIAGSGARGMMLSGLSNITGDRTAGVVAGGLLNVAGESAAGVQLSGMANITGKNFAGVSFSGLLNVAGNDMRGLQMAGLINVAGAKLAGMQIGLFNYATQADGVQLGLVNYRQKEMKGIQLGLINACPTTEVDILMYGGNRTAGNIAARFKNRMLYTIVGLGGYRLDLNDRFSATAFYRAGISVPVVKRLSLSGDVGFEHIEAFDNKDAATPTRLYALQTRISAELKIAPRFGFFLSGGYDWTRRYGHAGNFDKGLFGEAGIILSAK